MSTHQSIQFGVIGLGIGEQHAYAVFKNKDCVLRSVCDRDTALASRIANQFPGVTAANNFEERELF